MKMKKRMIAWISALAMITGLLTSCGGTSASGASGTGASAGDGEVVNLTWYAYGVEPKNGDAVIEALNKKSAEDIGVTVEFRWINTDDSSIMSLLSSGDSTVDLVYTSSSFGQYASSAKKRIFV